MRNSRSVFSTSSSLSFADRSENSQAPLLPIRPFFQTLHEVDSAKENSMSAEAARRAPLMSLGELVRAYRLQDRKSTRLNSSHLGISYAVFCLKKKNAK